MSDKKPDPKPMHPTIFIGSSDRSVQPSSDRSVQPPMDLLRVRFRADVQIPPNIISYWSTEPSKRQGVTMRAAPDGIVIESDKGEDFEDVVPWSNVSSYRRAKVK